MRRRADMTLWLMTQSVLLSRDGHTRTHTCTLTHPHTHPHMHTNEEHGSCLNSDAQRGSKHYSFTEMGVASIHTNKVWFDRCVCYTHTESGSFHTRTALQQTSLFTSMRRGAVGEPKLQPQQGDPESTSAVSSNSTGI